MSETHTTDLYAQPLQWWRGQIEKLTPEHRKKFLAIVNREWLDRRLRALPWEDLDELQRMAQRSVDDKKGK